MKTLANYEIIFKKLEETICIEIIIILSLKFINIFLIVYTKCARTFLYVLQCAANQKSLRTTDIGKVISVLN
jgi:hypothetical protein